jgi:hypothetical protein
MKRPELVCLTPHNYPVLVDVELIATFARDIDHGVIECVGRIDIGVDDID